MFLDEASGKIVFAFVCVFGYTQLTESNGLLLSLIYWKMTVKSIF